MSISAPPVRLFEKSWAQVDAGPVGIDGKHGSQKPGSLKLVDYFVSDSGVDFTTYEPAGEVQTGSFETREPSEEELERRQKWAKQEV